MKERVVDPSYSWYNGMVAGLGPNQNELGYIYCVGPGPPTSNVNDNLFGRMALPPM